MRRGGVGRDVEVSPCILDGGGLQCSVFGSPQKEILTVGNLKLALRARYFAAHSTSPHRHTSRSGVTDSAVLPLTTHAAGLIHPLRAL